MLRCLPLLFLLSTAAMAAEGRTYDPNQLETLPTAWVAIDAAAWLYAEPHEAAARFRTVRERAAPEYMDTPVIVLRQMARYGDFVRVRTVPQPADIQDDGRVGAPDTMTSAWPHCYPQPPAIAQWATDRWVRSADLLRVLTRDVDLTLPDGSRLQLEAGLTAIGKEGRYRVRTLHTSVLVALPDDAIGRSWPIVDDLPTFRGLVAQTDTGSHRAHPIWFARIDGTSPGLGFEAPKHPDALPTKVLTDRCMRLTPTQPLPDVPAYQTEALRAAKGWPVLVPFGTEVTDPQGRDLGQVAGSDYVLWSRQTCAWTELRGLCCDSLPGTETAGKGDQGVCFNADLPIRAADRGIYKVLSERQNVLTSRLGALDAARPTVRWSRPVIAGAITAEDVLDALQAESDNIHYCYARALARREGTQGDLTIRFAVAPDARARHPRIEVNEIEDDVLLDCVFRRIESLIVPMQLGETASVVDLTLTFSLGMSPTETAPDDERPGP